MGVTEGVTDGPGEVGVLVGVGGVKLGTGVSTGVVGPGVGGVGVAELPNTVRLPGTKSIAVKVLVPCETRALHSTAVWPACAPVKVKVNAVPSAVALLPPLPATATIKLPL